MIRILALYSGFGARRYPLSIAALTSDKPPMLSCPLQPQHLPQSQDSCSRHQRESSRYQAAGDHSLTSLLTALVSFQLKCIGTVSGNEMAFKTAALHPSRRVHRVLHDCTASSLSQSSSPSEAKKAFTDLPASSSRRQPSRQSWYRRPSPESQQAASQVVHDMHAALRRKDYTLVKRLLDPQLAFEVMCPVQLITPFPVAGFVVITPLSGVSSGAEGRGGGVGHRRELVALFSHWFA